MFRDADVYVIDDEPEMRRSIELLLAVEGIACRSFPNAESFLDHLPHLPSGIVLSDSAMEGMSGLDLLRALPAFDRADPVILVTGRADVPMVVAAFKAGAIDLIEKPFEAPRLLDAVKSARDAVSKQAGNEHCLASLSPRERQVLKHVVAGMTAKQTAIALDISPRTVETYRQHLMEKTGATCLPQLIRFGLEVQIDQH